MVLAIAATFCAVGLILFVQHRALSALESQTQVILRQVAEQTANDIAVEVRKALDGPVFDTLTGVNHPELRAGRLDLVARRYEEGLAAYPQVERFFVWSAETQAKVPGEALFYERRGDGTPPAVPALAPFTRHSALGKAILTLARRHAPEQRIYVAADTGGVAPERQVLLRLFWTDANRDEYFAVLGYVVDPLTAARLLFSALHAGSVGELLGRRGGGVGLRLHVTDQIGRSVYGMRETKPAAAAAATATLPLLFYPPDRIESRLSGSVAPHTLHMEVSAPGTPSALDVTWYWPTIVSVGLMLVALTLTLQAKRRAEDFAHMQADFVAHVSHQLKTPLSLLSVVTETLSMERVRSPEKLAQYVSIISGEVTRLSALVKRILEFSRLEQQRRYEFEQVDLTALVRETVAAFQSSLSGLQFTFRVEEGASGLEVLADPAAIEQALVNLLDNAVKYSADLREITVRVHATGTEAVIEVADRGIGIEERDQRRIFEKFYRGDGAARHRDGFGLGLPIAQQLAHAHNGRLEFTSVPGRGSTFRMVLPAHATDLPLPRSQQASMPLEKAV
jgi:nitrogen-specific signal transduction histidine kinase